MDDIRVTISRLGYVPKMALLLENILEELNNDLVSYGWLVQSLTLSEDDALPSQARISSLLSELLGTGNVDIGMTLQTKPDYVAFIAWNGTVEVRVSRAMSAVDGADDPDREFAYWLCLKENIDRYEDEVDDLDNQ